MAHKPTSELVLTAWLKGVDGLPAGQIGTTLPEDTSKWADGFVQVLTVGGTPHLYLPVRRPVVSVDLWAPPAGSTRRPQWGLANGLAEIIRDACYAADAQRLVSIDVGDYADARVTGIAPTTEPRRVPGDVDGFAHYSMDVEVHWRVANPAGIPT